MKKKGKRNHKIKRTNVFQKKRSKRKKKKEKKKPSLVGFS